MKKSILLILSFLIIFFIVIFLSSTNKKYVEDLILTTIDSSNALIIVKNNTQDNVKFNFSLNGKFYFSLNDFIRKNKNSNDSEQIAINLFNAQINSLVHENLYNEWGVLPLLTLNSRGFALCGKQSEIFCQITHNAGFPSRSIRLNGHAVSEVFYHGKWHLFDTDRKTYFQINNEILSYEKLIKEPSLFKQQGLKKYIANITTIFKKYTEHFITTNDNKFINIKKNNTDTFLLSIPSNATFSFPYPPDYITDFYPYNTKAKLFIPKGFNGTIKNPLILINVEGTGEIKINNTKYIVPKELELLRTKLFLSKKFISSIKVTSLSDSFALVYMLNPMYTKIYSKNNFHINASDSLKTCMVQNENKSKNNFNSMHIEMFNKYAPLAFELVNCINVSQIKKFEDLYNKSLKEYCITKMIDTNKVHKRLLNLNKILVVSKRINFNEPILFSVLAVVLYADNYSFKNMYLFYFKYIKYKELVHKFKKNHTSK